ncbi:hypothetical protein A3C23_02765 [Candidatus Roizmanbacteria bacterium RIFCSPHIGHO2_02_FULL_37_13b]|uniref:phosphoserine phosphatase n=1 Tax=Candidatus Roizmanbacteria bacterium RIFCSPLOWO2_02_FULL_36_11 TaxID=1802071 RepID=A0A1F7JGB1_9BACT|nr:MAG: hypothetical protein A3C23_02765 [Candidatus Roizmanbacteria bacterium RIFCSPHIGHO2_02_FULL_37_13b]OGK54596.1 MAG: hypothetical protein A3H78_01785 [Candidatus Roizmanbacteria bacterium RIFCSPLOWO2_02_FULL_36_11]
MNGPNKHNIALFDIDGTIFRSSLTVELVNSFFRAGLFPKTAKKDMENDYLAWINRKGDYDTFSKKLIEILLAYLPGLNKDRVDIIVEQVIKWQQDRVYRYPRDLIKKLRRKKYYLIAISGSPSYIVKKFAINMGFHVAYGLHYEVINGEFTGRILNMNPVSHKELVLNHIIEKYELKPDWANSVAVGDTDIDIPLLEQVGNPIAFNPNQQLADYAKKKHWKIVIERKDVIYEIKKFSYLK